MANSVTLSQVRAEVRARLAEPESDFYSDENLNGWINQGQHELVRRTEAMRSRWTIHTHTDQSVYPAPNDLLKIEQVWWRQSPRDEYYALDYRPLSRFPEIPNTTNMSGDPESLTWRGDNLLVITPIPSAVSTNGLVLDGQQKCLNVSEDEHYLFRPVNITDESSPFVVGHWMAIVNYACARASESDKDLAMAKHYSVQWELDLAKARAELGNQVAVRWQKRPFMQRGGTRTWPRMYNRDGVTP